MNNQQFHHIPVLLNDVLIQLDPQPGESYLDLTAGYGGHAGEVIKRIGNTGSYILVDRDAMAQGVLKEKFPEATRLQMDFYSAAQQLATDGKTFDNILIDLGVSSPQLDTAERGFSFRFDAPLDMRMDQSKGITAAELIATTRRDDLAEIIVKYGEEKPKLAMRIAEALKKSKPETTIQAAEIIKSVYPGGYHKINPATRTFQALRIAVNDELGQIEKTLELIPKLLNPGGRVAVISFHSLEDRIVKQYFKEQMEAGYESELRVKTKKPIDGSINDKENPRSRSSKLRVAAK